MFLREESPGMIVLILVLRYPLVITIFGNYSYKETLKRFSSYWPKKKQISKLPRSTVVQSLTTVLIMVLVLTLNITSVLLRFLH